MIALLLGLLLALGDTLSEAEDAYRAGRYADAHALYIQALADPDLPRGPIFYNLGNCAFRLGRQVEALFHYRRAMLRMPRDPELRFNLQFTERQLGIDPPGGSWTAWLTPGELLLLAGTLQVLGLAGLFLLRQHAARILMALLVLLSLYCGFQLIFDQMSSGQPPGIALQKIPLRAEPHSQLPVALQLEPGETLRVHELSDRWAKVSSARGEGWTPRAGVGVIH